MDWSLLFLCLANGLVNVVYALMGPFYPSVASGKGVSPLLVGVVFSLMPAAAFVTSPFLGEYLDRLTRKGGLALGLLLQAVAMGLVAWAADFDAVPFVVVSLLSRLFSGVSMALVETSCFALAASAYPDKVERNMSLFEASAGAGMMLGPVISAQIYDYVGFSGIFYGMALIFLLFIPGVLMVLEPARMDIEQEGDTGVLAMLMIREVILDTAAVAYVIMCVGVMEAYVSEHLLSLGLSIPAVGLAFAAGPLCYTVCCYLYSRKLKTLNMTRVFQGGIVTGSLAILLMGPPYPLPESVVSVIVGMTLVGLASASTFVPALPHMLQAVAALGFSVDDKLNDVLSGLTSGAFSLGELLGPIVGGLLLTCMDFRNMVTVIGVAGLVLLLAYTLLYRNRLIPLDDIQDSINFYKRIHTSLFAY